MLNAVSLTYWSINSITVTVMADIIIFSTPSASRQQSYYNLWVRKNEFLEGNSNDTERLSAGEFGEGGLKGPFCK